MDKITLTELKCNNCQAPLVITTRSTVECDWCGATYHVSNLTELVNESSKYVEDDWDDSMYFWSPPIEFTNKK